MRKHQEEWRREHAQVVARSGADCDEAQEIAEDVLHLDRLLDRAERRIEERAAAEAFAEGSPPEAPSAGVESHATTESRSSSNVAHVDARAAETGRDVAEERTE